MTLLSLKAVTDYKGIGRRSDVKIFSIRVASIGNEFIVFISPRESSSLFIFSLNLLLLLFFYDLQDKVLEYISF